VPRAVVASARRGGCQLVVPVKRSTPGPDPSPAAMPKTSRFRWHTSLCAPAAGFAPTDLRRPARARETLIALK